MRIAKGIKQNLTVGFKQEYLQRYQYNMIGVRIQVTNPPVGSDATFTLKLNGVVSIPDTALKIIDSQYSVNVLYSVVLYQDDVLTFECTATPLSTGNPVFFGIY